MALGTADPPELHIRQTRQGITPPNQSLEATVGPQLREQGVRRADQTSAPCSKR